MVKESKTKGKVDLTQMSKYSPEQQCCVVKLLIEDVEFRSKAIDLIDINSLNADPTIRQIASIVVDLHSKGVMFDYDTIKVYINSKVSSEIDRERTLAMLHQNIECIEMSPVSIQFLKNDLYPMLMVQEGRRLQGMLNDMLKSEKVSKEKLMNAFKEFDNRTTFVECTYEQPDSSIEEVKRLLQCETYEYVPTSSRLVNIALGGGLRKGDVGLLIAGSGVAKTCITTSFVASNAWMGKKVAHIVLEDKKDDILKKYLAFVTNIQPYDQYKRRDDVMSVLKEYSEQYKTMLSNIRGVYACKNNNEIKVMSVKDIDKELERMVNDGFCPDMVVVDYYDRIKKNGKDIWVEDERIINDLLNLATKYNVALWCPSQGGKSAQNRNVDMGLDNMSGGTWKTYGAQIVVAFQKKDGDDDNVFTLSILKNRYFGKYKSLKVEFNNGTCRFVNEEQAILQMNESNECIDDMFEHYKYQKAKEAYDKSR